MSCELPREVLNYLEAVEADKPRACREQHALAAHIRQARGLSASTASR